MSRTSIPIERVKTARALPEGPLGFGKVFTDHMFLMRWHKGQWTDARVVPYAPLSLDPAASVLHYGQALFDGFKAFRGKDDRVRLFRPQDHLARMVKGAPRMCMPGIDLERALEGVKTLVDADRHFVPPDPASALYLRPTLIADEAFLGVRPAESYLFFVIACPVGAYYGDGMKPVRIFVEQHEVRAAAGGLGAVKAPANYAASLHAAHVARQAGFAQVLWLDAKEHKYLEEVGTMNVFVQIGDEVITPPLHDSILAGITRDSVLKLLRATGMKVSERPLEFAEIVRAHKDGSLREVFGTGTAAVITAVGELSTSQEKYIVADGNVGPLAKRLQEELTGIQYARKPDPFGWMTEI